MSSASLTTTSYAILGLLAIRPWSTYELTQQMDRSLGRMWPRAQSKLYEEPKKLVAEGLATATPGVHGRRPRTVYSITPRGRQAVAAWLAADSAPPVFESEHLLKVFYADSGSASDVLATLVNLRAWVHELSLHNVRVANSYLEGAGPYPERFAILVLTGRFLDDYLEMIDRWASWASEMVRAWPAEPRKATPDLAAMAVTARQAADRAKRWTAESASDSNATATKG
jgi:PadR family transcriptional regulator, regulatory protein AphA